MLSKALVTGVYQKKLEEMAAASDLELLVVVPPKWVEGRVGTLELDRLFTTGYELEVQRMAFNGRHHLHFYPDLRKVVERFQPELIHIDEEPYNLVAAQATRLARRVGAKTIFFTWQNLYRRYPPPFRLFELYAYRNADAAIAGNADAVEVLRRKGFGKPVEIIPQFGVDPDIFSPSTSPPPSDQPITIGYYGRLVPEKGVDTLIDAIALLPQHPRLVIVGAGESLDALKERAAQRGLGDRVSFRGTMPSAQIPSFLHELDIVVVPSLTRPNWKEQFGRVIIEAMSCGVAVVGSDSGEIPNVIGDAGLTFPEGDVAALTTQLGRLLADPALLAHYSSAGRQRVLDNYTQRQVAARTVALYRDVLEAGVPERDCEDVAADADDAQGEFAHGK